MIYFINMGNPRKNLGFRMIVKIIIFSGVIIKVTNLKFFLKYPFISEKRNYLYKLDITFISSNGINCWTNNKIKYPKKFWSSKILLLYYIYRYENNFNIWVFITKLFFFFTSIVFIISKWVRTTITRNTIQNLKFLNM